MKGAGLGLTLVLALAVQTTLAPSVLGSRSPIDLVLVLVIFVALRHGAVAGLLFGSLAGLCQDALSGGIIGVGGLAKSLVGAGLGALATKFIIANPLPRFVAFVVGTLLHGACFIAVYAMIDPETIGRPWTVLLPQAPLNAVTGLVMFAVVDRLPDAWRRRRMRRTHLRTRGIM